MANSLLSLSSLFLLSLLLILLLGVSASETGASVTVDGGWSPWSTLATSCVRVDPGTGRFKKVTCGGGQRQRFRSCTNPKPSGPGHKECEGRNVTVESCNTHPCRMEWSPWSNCSATCDRGVRRRVTHCALAQDEEEAKDETLVDCREAGLDDYFFEHVEECNTWNIDTCPGACEGYRCMEYALCVDISDETRPRRRCECQFNRIMDEKGESCVEKPPLTSTKRPDPTLPSEVKTAVTIVTRTASTVLIVCVGTTLFLFASLRIFDDGRVIQMNMELALIMAHIVLVFPPLHEFPELCRFISIALHLLFTAVFSFLLLESLHMYAVVAFVTKTNGLLTKTQNVIVGWGLALATTLVSVGLCFNDYGGDYHCWLNADIEFKLFWLHVVPIAVMAVLALTLIEAAGNADYKALPGGNDRDQLLSGRITQRSNLVILPLLTASYGFGVAAEYEQNIVAYGTFTMLNGILGVCVFFFHSTGNEKVRRKITKAYELIFKQN